MIHYRSIIIKYFILPISSHTIRVWIVVFGSYTCINSTLIHHERIFRSIQHIPILPCTLPAVRKVISHFRLTNLTAFSSNKNYTIRSTRTINSTRSSIFQNFDRSNVTRIQIIQTTFNRHTVYNIKRIGCTIFRTNRTYTTYTNLSCCTRLTGRGSNCNTSCQAFQSIIHTNRSCICQILR